MADRLFPKPGGPRVLIYHQVGAELGRQMEVTTRNFRRQLDWLSRNRQVVDLETAIAQWQEPGSDHLAVLTFDDGYRDTYETAFPLLSELGLPFTLYLATEPVETGIPLGPSEGAPPLTWDQISDMIGSGLVTVGAHTHRHVDLRYLAANEIEMELTRSDELIESRLGIQPVHFAYPWGYWSAEAEPFVRRRYRSAVLGGTPRPQSAPDPLRLHRYPVQRSDGFSSFEPRLVGGFRLEEAVRRRLKGYSGP